MRRLLAAGLVLALGGGCQKDPVWFGYWEITEGSRDGARQQDLGSMEIMRNGNVALFLRYTWSPEGWTPDPQPQVVFGSAGVSEQDDIIAAYRQKDEVYELYLTSFCTDQNNRLKVNDYQANRAVVSGKTQIWPGRPETELLPVELHLER